MDLAKYKPLLIGQDSGLMDEFKEELYKKVGLYNHPHAYSAFVIAWEYGHQFGLNEVVSHMRDLSMVIKGEYPFDKEDIH